MIWTVNILAELLIRWSTNRACLRLMMMVGSLLKQSWIEKKSISFISSFFRAVLAVSLIAYKYRTRVNTSFGIKGGGSFRGTERIATLVRNQY